MDIVLICVIWQKDDKSPFLFHSIKKINIKKVNKFRRKQQGFFIYMAAGVNDYFYFFSFLDVSIDHVSLLGLVFFI